MVKVLVCGGRDFNDRARLFAALDELHEAGRVAMIIHGDARGADKMAGRWALERGVRVKAYPADWQRYKNAAGPIRNRLMLVDARPNFVVAFPGGAGTADMVRQAKRAGLEVLQR